MKRIAQIALLSATTCVAVNAAPFMAVGDNAELFVTAAAEVQSDSNIYLSNTSEKDDLIYSFTPGVDLVFGKGAVNKGNVYFREEIRRYSDYDEQNVELSSFGAKSDYDNGVTKVNLSAAYAQLAQNSADVNPTDDIARRDVTNLLAKSEFAISEKTSLAVGVTFDKTEYKPTAFTDSDIWSVPVDVYYKASPKLDWSVGYRYRSSELSGSGADSSDNFFNIGARGEFTPKLTGQVRVGYGLRDLDAGGDESQLGFDGSLTYAYSQKTNYVLTFGNDFASAGTGDSTKNLNVGLTASTRFTEQWSANAGLTLRTTEYPTRTDDFFEGTLGVTYVYSTYVNFAATLFMRDNGSDSATGASEFSQNVFSLAANIRY